MRYKYQISVDLVNVSNFHAVRIESFCSNPLVYFISRMNVFATHLSEMSPLLSGQQGFALLGMRECCLAAKISR